MSYNATWKPSKIDKVLYGPTEDVCSVGFSLSKSDAEHIMWITYNLAGEFWIVAVDGKIQIRSKDRESILRWLHGKVGLESVLGRKMDKYERKVVSNEKL